MYQLTPQQKAALDYKTHISLTANAGSGKTFVLSKRFVEIFLNEDVELSSIVAITFTDKAAGELNRKIANEVDERLSIETDGEKKRRLENLRRQLVSANISTIHSFCIDILREFAPEAEIDANFSPVDQSTADDLIRLSIEETINNFFAAQEKSDELKYLIRFFQSKNSFISQLENSIQHRRIIDYVAKNIYQKSENEIAQFFSDQFEVQFNKTFSDKIDRTIISLKKINEAVFKLDLINKHAVDAAEILNQIRPSIPSVQKLNLISTLAGSALTKDFSLRKQKYLSKNREEYINEIQFVESTLEDLANFLSVDFSKQADEELAKFGKAFLIVYNYAVNLYTEKKKKSGYLDFEDILLHTQKILLIEDVKNYLSKKFRFIMIDEYQDTNELQYEIFMPILDNLQSGNLFVVGDEKQSIYMFRNAEPEVFEKTKSEIRLHKNEGQLLSLPHSFRMAPPLVLFTNLLFKNLFGNANPVFNEVEHNDLICAKDETESGNVEILLADSGKGQTESEMVAKRILLLISSSQNNFLQLKDIAILCRKRSAFAELEKSFVQHKIPFTVIGGKGFFQRQTIYDVYNYLSFLLNKEDDAALVGVLRSPFFNVSDLQLYEISLEKGNTFFEKTAKFAEAHQQMKYVFEKLKENLRIAFSIETYLLIRKIFLESGYWSVIAAKQNSTQELANVEKLLFLARNFSKKSFKNLYDFTIFLRDAINDSEDEGQAQVAKDENTVKFLTIHQAKGLEYKAVFLYGCNNITQSDAVKSKSISVDKNFGLLAKVPVNQNYFQKESTPQIVSWYNYSIHRKNVAEMKRLLYVGVTRAINYLFISASHKNLVVKKNSFLDLFARGLNTDFMPSEIVLQSDVSFMKFSDDKHDLLSKQISLSIPIKNEIDLQVVELAEDVELLQPKINLTERISDVPSNEIISATKISMFTQCPVKYQLTYELGYSTIYKLVKDRTNEYEFNFNEDDELRRFGQLRGRIIHAALKEELNAEKIRNFITGNLLAEEINDPNTREKLIDSITTELESFYESCSFKEISSQREYRNEFEVYCKEHDHFLYGIIDKLILEKDRLIILDYKTDNIPAEKLMQRSEDYFHQLTFYAYILSKLFLDYSIFELRLIFLKHSEDKIIRSVNHSDLNIFSLGLNQSIHKIYSGEFSPNLNHCSKCHFALDGNKCVKTN